jgi:(p)ppGpp synthase/HD superfamily hydrolase
VTSRQRLPDVIARRPKTRAAFDYAAERHAGQRRTTDDGPFIEHPLEVGSMLYRAGAPDQVIAAGVLHDVLEKTDASATELEARFGSTIAKLVFAVSENPKIETYARRKAALRRQVAVAGPDALMIFAADKVSKVGELRAAISNAERRGEPIDQSLFPPRRLAHFRHCLGLLEERLGESPLVEQLKSDLDRLNADLRRHTEIRAVA